ncbi:protein arginine kinase [Mammaliicoccus stepanovicii]|uniref:Protein-arginine kinase n=1 Tax=Mammaliicoccus stepanovicii TaxID=643214 RepID=A0A240AAI5_9STAP|nr:protein arginine kinase [Mammaliicoccus stepanovicii]PNZ77114.1 protein arginine kinase [Mammaliicoccus stepanovicii]GGI39773.1 protein-arginine kinase [Mammaliicoccus stepanovicii]SNV80289.1 ATP:guanido phosphotransferase [Mammaliicoccus stepanovicii]
MEEHINEHISDWMKEKTDTPIIMSSRIRLARNLQDEVHPLKYDDDQIGNRVIEKVTNALSDLKLVRLSDLSDLEKNQLVFKHLISPALTKQDTGAVLLNEEESTSVMINEEDHVRIQVMGNNLVLKELYDVASKVDDELDKHLTISYDEKHGFLTTCPTNIGTGLRASVMLHLPGLSIMKRMKRIGQAINRFGYTIRGIYGEGTGALGHVYQISNQLTLGKTEQEIIEDLTQIVEQIISEEEQIRSRLNRFNHMETKDRVHRAAGILKSAQLISVEEASLRLSEMKLGIDLGYIEHDDFNFDHLMVTIQTPFFEDEESKQSVDEKRATFLREHI